VCGRDKKFIDKMKEIYNTNKDMNILKHIAKVWAWQFWVACGR